MRKAVVWQPQVVALQTEVVPRTLQRRQTQGQQEWSPLAETKHLAGTVPLNCQLIWRDTGTVPLNRQLTWLDSA